MSSSGINDSIITWEHVSDERSLLDNISTSVSLLDNQGRYYKDQAMSLKNGLQFLGKLYCLSTNRKLANRMKYVASSVKYRLERNERNGVLDIMELDRSYEDLPEIMSSLVSPTVDGEYFRIFQEGIYSRHNYGRIIDLLLDNILVVQRRSENHWTSFLRSFCCEWTSVLISSWFTTKNASLVKDVRDLRMTLSYYKPLYRCLAHPSYLYHASIHTPLDQILSEEVVAIYLLVCKMDKNTVLSLPPRNRNIYVSFLKFSSSEFSSGMKGQFYILDNLIHLLEMNSDSLNDANKHLYAELRDLRTVVANYRGCERLNHYLGLTTAVENICYQAVPIVYSCYMEEGTHQELNDILISVIEQMKNIKHDHGSQEIKLYDHPRVDGSGFLKFFSEHLNDLWGHEQLRVIRNEIQALHTGINCLGKSQEEQILRLAYQAEYVIDIYLAIPESRCITTLSNIVEQVREVRDRPISLLAGILSLIYFLRNPPSSFSSGDRRKLLPDKNVFVGFQAEIKAISEYLTGTEKALQVISVVGMAGAGKTSLAKHLFNNPIVDARFDKKAWCTISQSYQRKDLLLTILKQINPVKYDNIRNRDDEEELATTLCQWLRQCRYLVVIDDAWDADCNYLRRYLPNDQTQSRVLITTRNHNVALKAKSRIHELRALTGEESWELMLKKMPQRYPLPENLESIARKICKSCKGLPLSIVIIGGLLHNAEKNEKMWNQIAKDVNSTILSDPQGKCVDILELSYKHLPDHLKSCLLYLGVFPEDQEISVHHVVRLWVAEGLVRDGITSEDKGNEYVMDLISRSLVIPVKENTKGGVKGFQLHDLLRDFCLKKAKEEHFFTMLDDASTFDLSQPPRRMMINGGMDKYLPVIYLNSVRTILSLQRTVVDVERIIQPEHMMLLNVLDMHELKDPAPYLQHSVHLRYLAIWKIGVCDQVSVISSICKMWQLQVLILSFVGDQVCEVPDSIWDLVKLRHIHILPGALFHCHDSNRIEDSYVQSLSKPRLHYGDSNWLSKLPRLRKLSCIIYSYWVNSMQQYRFPKLHLCDQLTSLKVENGVDENARERCKLHLPSSLKKLSLSKFKLDSDDLAEIGKSLPNLVVLKLHDSVESWSVNDEDFQELKVLKISGGCFLEWDASDDSFPLLEQLWMERCHSLEEIPLRFEDIPNLRLISIKDCNGTVKDSATEIQKEQHEAQNLKLKVIV